ncbi:MAG: hypothetical protein QOE64_932 [Frankiales bacterium]|nr:hypothetical protein [Frankiales bacterium]
MPRPRTSTRLTPLLGAYVGVLALAAAAVALAGADGGPPPGRVSWPALPALALLVATAEWFTVRFRVGREVNALNLVEAVLAPLLFSFTAPWVVLAVAAGQLATGALRRNTPIKVAFNIAEMALAAGCGALVVDALSNGRGLTAGNLAALLAGLAVVLLVNQAAFVLVLMAADPSRAAGVLRQLAPVMVPGWLGGWAVNALIGMLYVLAYVAHPAAVVLFAVPLVVLHLAYRGYAVARAERHRLNALHRAAQALATPLDPRDGISAFLAEVAACFDAGAASLVLRGDGVREVRRVSDQGETVVLEPDDVASLEGALAAQPGPMRLVADRRDPLGRELTERGHRECLSAPLLVEGRLTGVLIVLDRAGLEGFGDGEMTVLEALAREAASALGRGRLLASVLEERRRLSEIVSTTSDGIATIGRDGTVLSWNPALVRSTGLAAEDVIGRPGALTRLRARTVAGNTVDIGGWHAGGVLPADLVVSPAGEGERRLMCSYSVARDDEGQAQALVVVARDVTTSSEVEELREEVGRLAEAEAARRAVVEQLQQAVMPVRPEVAGADLGVSYLPSDPSAPTGGDIYDWQVLPDGEVHLCVVDVLGHGVGATKDALAVVHTLRVVTAEGRPLEDVVVRADELLSAQHPELVATVVIARYNPSTGRLRVAAGGHPPALLVRADGEVEQLAASGCAIGWPGAGSDVVVETTLGVDDALVLYTDGLIEARKDVIEGMEALVRHATALSSLPAAELSRELIDRALAGAQRHDDTLALVLRRTPVEAETVSRQWVASPQLASVPEVRAELRAWLGTVMDNADDVVLAASELLANAVMAASHEVRLTATVTPSTVLIEVHDDGVDPGRLDELGRSLPSDEAERGRGLFLVRAIASEVEVVTLGEGTLLRATLTRTPTVPKPSTEPPRRLRAV